ncbi:MAG TPA: sigma-70 family RNA polymerase sigma factor [bacterium]|nr:sigma-70 family RNA polymerase sigma factor [bacterium]
MTNSCTESAAPGPVALGPAPAAAWWALANLWAALTDLFHHVPAAPLLLAAKDRSGKDKKTAAPKKESQDSGRPGKRGKSPQHSDDDDLPPDDDLPEAGDALAQDAHEVDELSDDELEPGEDGPEEEEPERRRSQSEWSGGSGAEDLDLIKRFLQGDNESFTRIVIKYQNKVHNLCFRILGDRDEAKDMAQEVFITLHKSLKNFRGESLFSTWVYRVTVNHCKNRIKYLGRRRYFQTFSIDQPQEVEDGELYYEPEDESPDPEKTLASEEIQALVQDAIAGLDPDHRIVVVLRDIQDLSYEEIADIVGIKVGTVKSRIHRARNDLKKKLEGKIKL